MENDEESTDTASNVDVTGCGINADGKAEYDENQNNDNSNDKMTTMIEIWWLKQIVVIKEDETNCSDKGRWNEKGNDDNDEWNDNSDEGNDKIVKEK